MQIIVYSFISSFMYGQAIIYLKENGRMQSIIDKHLKPDEAECAIPDGASSDMSGSYVECVLYGPYQSLYPRRILYKRTHYNKRTHSIQREHISWI